MLIGGGCTRGETGLGASCSNFSNFDIKENSNGWKNSLNNYRCTCNYRPITSLQAHFTFVGDKQFSDASNSIKDSNTRESKRLHKEMLHMQKLSDNTRNELTEYMAKVENSYYEGTFSAAESWAIMNSCLQNW